MLAQNFRTKLRELVWRLNLFVGFKDRGAFCLDALLSFRSLLHLRFSVVLEPQRLPSHSRNHITKCSLKLLYTAPNTFSKSTKQPGAVFFAELFVYVLLVKLVCRRKQSVVVCVCRSFDVVDFAVWGLYLVNRHNAFLFSC